MTGFDYANIAILSASVLLGAAPVRAAAVPATAAGTVQSRSPT